MSLEAGIGWMELEIGELFSCTHQSIVDTSKLRFDRFVQFFDPSEISNRICWGGDVRDLPPNDSRACRECYDDRDRAAEQEPLLSVHRELLPVARRIGGGDADRERQEGREGEGSHGVTSVFFWHSPTGDYIRPQSNAGRQADNPLSTEFAGGRRVPSRANTAAPIRLPRSCTSRKEPNLAQLVREPSDSTVASSDRVHRYRRDGSLAPVAFEIRRLWLPGPSDHRARSAVFSFERLAVIGYGQRPANDLTPPTQFRDYAHQGTPRFGEGWTGLTKPPHGHTRWVPRQYDAKLLTALGIGARPLPDKRRASSPGRSRRSSADTSTADGASSDRPRPHQPPPRHRRPPDRARGFGCGVVLGGIAGISSRRAFRCRARSDPRVAAPPRPAAMVGERGPSPPQRSAPTHC